MKTATEYWYERFGEYPQNDSEKLAVAMMQEYAFLKQDELIEKIVEETFKEGSRIPNHKPKFKDWLKSLK